MGGEPRVLVSLDQRACDKASRGCDVTSPHALWYWCTCNGCAAEGAELHIVCLGSKTMDNYVCNHHVDNYSSYK